MGVAVTATILPVPSQSMQDEINKRREEEKRRRKNLPKTRSQTARISQWRRAESGHWCGQRVIKGEGIDWP
jgi:hypothetical protein